MIFLDQVSMYSLMLIGMYVYFASGKVLVSNVGKLLTGEKVCSWSCLVSISVLVLYTYTYFLMSYK